LKEMMTLSRGSLIVKDNNLSSFPGAQMINTVGSRLNTLKMVDLTDNDLGDEGVGLVAQGLSHSTSVEHLIINGNFKPGRTRAIRVAAIDALIGLLRSTCPLRTLEATGGKNAQLKLDILPLLAVLCTNSSLTSLDISGHMMGNKGATGLGKAIQTNSALTKLKWDSNGTTLAGFTYFRIGMKANHHLVNMQMPYADIFGAMKANNWENSTNEKLLPVIRDIEGYLTRNLLRNRPLSTSLSQHRQTVLLPPPKSSTITFKDFEQWMGSHADEGYDPIENNNNNNNEDNMPTPSDDPSTQTYSYDEMSIYE